MWRRRARKLRLHAIYATAKAATPQHISASKAEQLAERGCFPSDIAPTSATALIQYKSCFEK